MIRLVFCNCELPFLWHAIAICLRDCDRLVSYHVIVIHLASCDCDLLVASVQYLLASRVAMLIRSSLLAGMSFVFCFAMLARWACLIAFWLTIIAFLCDCVAPAILDLLAPFAKLFASVIFLLMVVARQLLLSCSSKMTLVFLAIVTHSLLILLNAFFIFLGCCPFAILLCIVVVSSFRDSGDSASRPDSYFLVRQKDPLESMIIMSQGPKPDVELKG